MLTDVRSEIDASLARSGGAASRRTLLGVVTRDQLDDEIARRQLVAVFPRAYCRPWDADDPRIRERAALMSVGKPVGLSHLSGLRRWDLPAHDSTVVHVTVPIGRHPNGQVDQLLVHRTRSPTPTRLVDGLLIVAPAVAIVQSWPLMSGSDQRAPAIEASRRRLVTPAELRVAAGHAAGLAGRAQLKALIDQLEAGCESELELWGYLEVFDVPGLRHGMRQKVLHVNGRRYRLDLAYEDERVAIELDGFHFHSTREQRERDMRRDAALSSTGWVTLRYSHSRLHNDVAGCRRDTLATLEARRDRSVWRPSG